DCDDFMRYEDPCEHIAATLLQIYEIRSELATGLPHRPPVSPEGQAADELLALFAGGAARGARPANAIRRELLAVEATVRLRELPDQSRILTVELRLGPGGKTYVVSRIREFLDAY